MLMLTPAEIGVPDDCQLIDITEVAQIVKHSKREIERWVATSVFPAPLNNEYSRKRLWRLSDVTAWVRRFGGGKLP